MEEDKKNIPESEADAAFSAAPGQSEESAPTAASSGEETTQAPAAEGADAEEAPASAEENAETPAEDRSPADEGEAPASESAPDGADAWIGEEIFVPAASAETGTGNSVPPASAAGPAPAAEAASAASSASAAPASESGNYDIEVKRPKRGRVRDRAGMELGKLRRGVWYDNDKNRRGEFVKEDDKNVYLYEGENENRRRTGYVDKHNNIHTLQNEYIGTIVHARTPWLLILCILLAVITALTCILCAWALTRSESPYAPIIFATEEDGTNWEDTEDLKVFYNQTFGDRVIMPGMTGAYRFRMQNRSPDPIVYSLTFSETNEYGISILYRLKRDGVYIAGEDGYVTAEELCQEDLTVEEESITLFELEWVWAHNDAVDTVAGENEAIYYLHIDFLAEVWQERQ